MPTVTHPVLVQPEFELTREGVRETAVRFLGEDFPRLGTLMRIVENAGVENRRIVRPLDEILARDGLKASNDVYIDAYKELATRAASEALAKAGLEPEDVDVLITTSCTGFMIPSVCAHIIPELGMRRDCIRLPVTELGCAAGAAALSRARDFCLARPGANVLIVAGEFCSLCFQPGDLSMQALVGALLFGDGVAATVVRDSDDVSGFKLTTSGSYLFEGSWDYMGFDVRDSGFHLILDKGVPGAVERQIAPVMKGFLQDRGVDRASLDFWCMHPGGRKLMEAVERSFELSEDDLRASRECLQEVGNLSSASVLVVLKLLFERHRPKAGETGFLAAFGPGFSVEMSLGEWVEA